MISFLAIEKLPRESAVSVMIPNQISTWLSQEAWSVAQSTWKLGCCVSQTLTYRFKEDARMDVNPPGRPICRCREVTAAGSSSAKQPASKGEASGLLDVSLGLLISEFFQAPLVRTGGLPSRIR